MFGRQNRQARFRHEIPSKRLRELGALLRLRSNACRETAQRPRVCMASTYLPPFRRTGLAATVGHRERWGITIAAFLLCRNRSLSGLAVQSLTVQICRNIAGGITLVPPQRLHQALAGLAALPAMACSSYPAIGPL